MAEVRYKVIVDDGFSKPLDSFERKVKGVDPLIGTMNNQLKTFKNAVLGYFAVDSVVAFGKEVIKVTSEFQKFNAVLTNTLGSRSLAIQAMNQIKEIAATTPFSVSELTESYVKLANQGFRPTREEIIALGDLASSTGKNFDQLTEALIDAQVGEFERLKEFGVRAKKEGDKVIFTFKGVKTSVDFTDKAIRNYITSLGKLEGVTGSMAAISETMGGKISNLGDSWESLMRTIGDGNSGPLSGAIGLLNTLVQSLEKVAMTSEQMNAKVRSSVVARQIEKENKRDEETIQKIMSGGASREQAEREVFTMGLNKTRENLGLYNQRLLRDQAELASMEVRVAMKSRFSSGREYDAFMKQIEEKRKEVNFSKILLEETEAMIGSYELRLKDLGNMPGASAVDSMERSIDQPKEAQKKLNESVNSVVGAAPKVININIGSLIEENNNVINNASSPNDLATFQKKLTETLVRVVNDAQIALG